MPERARRDHPTCRGMNAIRAVDAAFDDEGPYDPDLARCAALIFAATAHYLARCLGPARPAAVPDREALADLTVVLHAATTMLSRGLADLATHRTLPDRDVLPTDPRERADCRARLLEAAIRLHDTAATLHAAHHLLADTTPGRRP